MANNFLTYNEKPEMINYVKKQISFIYIYFKYFLCKNI